MLGLMEPESLRSSGYEIPESSGVRDRLDMSAKLVTTIGALSMSDHRISRLPVSLMFVCAAGYAPVRTAASQAIEVATFQDSMRKLIVSTLLIGITTLVIAVYTSWKRSKPHTQDKSTQTSTPHDSDRAQDASDDIFVYPQGRRFHTSWNCRAVT
eukprot:6467539-Amphidinium_carterae.1